MSGRDSSPSPTQKKGARTSSSSSSSSSSTSTGGAGNATSGSFSGSMHQDGPPPTTTKPINPLATFLQRDIQPPPEGHRLLLPYLTFMDRLRLSECSRGLLPYRHHLTELKIRQHPPSERTGLEQLLLCQQQLQHLRMDHDSLVPMLGLASQGGCFTRLKILDLSNVELTSHMTHVVGVFQQGRLKALEELDLCRAAARGYPGLGVLFRLFKEGACPLLRRLSLSDLKSALLLLAEALESGNLHRLQTLELLECGGGREVSAIARALGGGACPQLVDLILVGCGLSPVDGQALGEALQSGYMTALEHLGLDANGSLGNVGFMAIFGALEAGSCPSLTRLDITHAYLQAESATALAHALRSGHCHRLQCWDLEAVFSGQASCLTVLQAIQQTYAGVLPNLRHLIIPNAKMEQEHGEVLGAAIRGGSLPQLEELHLSGNHTLGDAGGVPIVAGLEGGGCPHLKQLELAEISMGPQGGQALARALASGHLSCLDMLKFGANLTAGDDAMAEVVMGLRQCPKLAVLDVMGTGMGELSGEVLLKGLREGWWLSLGELNISDNPALGDDVVGIGLAEVLGGEGGGKLPRLRTLHIQGSGLTREGAEWLLTVIAGGAGPRLECVSMGEGVAGGRGWEARLRGRGIELICDHDF